MAGRRPAISEIHRADSLPFDPFPLAIPPFCHFSFPFENMQRGVLVMNKEHHLPMPKLVATNRAAEILGRSPATLKRWRYQGTGPDYVEIEGRVRYDLHVLLEFIRKNTRVPSVRAAKEETRGVV